MPSSIESGSSIAHYRVISPLGRGGMGEVYLAHDPKLDRSIALKVLPPELVTNEERVRRFVQEAKSASSLSHPHIITIYEIGTAPVKRAEAAPDDGSGPIHYIAMELIQGDTLRTKIHKDRTELRKLLGYLAQAAQGLAKAHAAGIVHRDLKPDNIMVTSDGYAKVLDFGLAKLNAPPAGAEGSESETAVIERTREGVVMGTIGYMAPEQLEGQHADPRSDIFSFGCILYEAAARKRPFTAATNVDVMHKILHGKPEPLEVVAPETPAELRRIVRRCLAKEPEKRYQSIKDLALELADLVEDYDSLTPGSGSTQSGVATVVQQTGPPAQRGKHRRGIVIAVMAVAVIAGAAMILRRLSSTSKEAAPETPPATNFANMTMKRVTSTGHVTRATISPDGRYIAHAIRERGMSSLRVRQVATGVDIEVVPPAPLSFNGVTFTQDGNYLYFVRLEPERARFSSLYQVASLGGASRKLVFDVDTPPTFSPDGTRMAFVRGYPYLKETAVVITSADGSGEVKLKVRKWPNDYPLLKAAWSPDGKTIAAVTNETEGGFHLRIVAIDTATGYESYVGPARWVAIEGLAWLPEGKDLVVAGTDRVGSPSQLSIVSFASGSVRRITNDLNHYYSVSTTSDGSMIATVPSMQTGRIWAVPKRGAGEARAMTAGGQEAVGAVSTMPDGSIVFSATVNGIADLWVIDPSGSRRQLTFGPVSNSEPYASADGRTIVYTAVTASKPHIWKMDVSGENRAALTRGDGEFSPAISPDGTWVSFMSADRSLWRVDVNGGNPKKLGAMSNGYPWISPDGERIVTMLYEQKPDKVYTYIHIIDAATGQPLEAFEAGFNPRWSPGVDAIDCTVITAGVTNIWRHPLDGSPAKQLTKFTEGTFNFFAWLPDETLVFSKNDRTSDVVLVSNFR